MYLVILFLPSSLDYQLWVDSSVDITIYNVTWWVNGTYFTMLYKERRHTTKKNYCILLLNYFIIQWHHEKFITDEHIEVNFCLALHSSPLVIITYKHKWNICSMKVDSRSRGWMGWLTTHHECYGFLIYHQTYFQNHWQEDKFLNFSGYASRPPSKSMLSVVHALCKLDQHCQTPPLNSTSTYDNTHDMSMKEPTWNLSQPLTLIYFWMSACLDFLILQLYMMWKS